MNKSNYSSKVKDILIELKTYGFYHSPFNMESEDGRFIGRQKIAQRLKSLLTNNQTKSGAYLITGYRGMGKTSLINKILTDLNPVVINSSILSRLLRILLPLFFLSLLNLQEHQLLLVVIPLALFVGAFIYLVRSDVERNDLDIYTSKDILHNSWKHFVNTFIIDKTVKSKMRFRSVIQDYYILSIIQIFSLAVFNFFDDIHSIEKMIVYVLVFGLISFFSYVSYNFHHFRKGSILSRLKLLSGDLLNGVKAKANYHNRIVIRISLGYENLQEIDILRLVTKRVKKSFQGLAGLSFGSPFNLHWKLAKVVLIYFLCGIVYYFQPIYRLNNDIKRELYLVEYFPTQGVVVEVEESAKNLVPNNNYLLKEIKILIEENENFTYESYNNFFIERYGERYFKNEVDRTDIIKEITTHIDFYLVNVYYYVKDFLTPTFLDSNDKTHVNEVNTYLKVKSISNHFRFVPPIPDYLFLLYFVIFWLLIDGLIFGRLLGIRSHKKILKRLEELDERLHSSVSVENNSSLEIPGQGIPFLKMFTRKYKSYAISDPREAEAELLDILDDIDKIPSFAVKPEFVIIFDELDKIEPNLNASITAKEEELKKEEDQNLYSAERIRRRQQKILRILANLKHFLNTAKSKFVFIAGREMFDLSLADISDRDYFIGSIFHEVVYVNSFLTDESDGKKPDVTSLTEQYVCQFLIPYDYDATINLKGYNKYLKEFVFKEDEPMSLENKRQAAAMRRKIIITLQNFVTFLTYRSNGAPKKITRLFEEYVAQPPLSDLKNDGKFLVIGCNSQNLYLKFNFYDQYNFGLITHLTSPFLLSVSKFMKDFGDKLLVSSSFLMDHLFKFHGNGFAWRNLELTPEIIDFNKAPELRSFIQNIIGFLTKTHVEEIVSGLYNFKFNDKIDEEIQYLSKISERESAAFNFTLDESQEVKQFYYNKLKGLQEIYRDTREHNYISSLGIIHMILGDLHYYDQEFDDAILNYRDAVQTLVLDKDNPDTSRLVLRTRNMLKLGLAFEKKKTYDSAFMTYGEITNDIMMVRNKDLSQLSIVEVELREADLGNASLTSVIHKYSKTLKKDLKKKFSNGTKVIDLVVHRPSTYSGEVSRQNGLNRNDTILGFPEDIREIMKKFDDTLMKENIYHDITTFEGIRIIYQPVLAKLFIIEKNNLGGVTITDIERAEKEFIFLTRIIDTDENFLIKSEFYNKLGDLLFYKNNCFNEHKKNAVVPKQMVNRPRDYKPPYSAIYYYELCLKTLCEGLEQNDESLNPKVRVKGNDGGTEDYNLMDSIRILFKTLKSRKEMPSSRRKEHLESLANNLSDLGDAYFAAADDFARIDEPFLQRVLSDINDASFNAFDFYKEVCEKDALKLALLLYFLSSQFFKEASVHKKSAFQRTKLFYVFLGHLNIPNPNVGHREEYNVSFMEILVKNIDLIEEVLVRKSLGYIHRSYDNSDRPEIEKLEETFSAKMTDVPLSGHQLAIGPDTREVVMLFLDLKVKCGINDLKVVDNIVSPFSHVNSKHLRLIDIRYKTRLLKDAYNSIGFNEVVSSETRMGFQINLTNIDEAHIESVLGVNMATREALEFLISDAIFCFTESIRTRRVFDVSYLHSHSNMAASYYHLAGWCGIYEKYISLCSKEEGGRMRVLLSELIGEVELNYITSDYNYRMALNHYYHCLDTYNENKTYKEMISKLHFLDDDFNGDLFHFSSALERYYCNTDEIRGQIDRIKAKISEVKSVNDILEPYLN